MCIVNRTQEVYQNQGFKSIPGRHWHVVVRDRTFSKTRISVKRLFTKSLVMGDVVCNSRSKSSWISFINLSTFPHQGLLLAFILDVGKGLDIASQFSHFGKGFNYRQGSLNRMRAFEDGSQHVQALFGEGFRINRRMLQPIEPVEIFHQFIFFRYHE